MNGIGDWISSYWFELGSLLFQGATLLTLIWFGKSLLKIMTASRVHAEAPQRLAVAEASAVEEPSYRGVVRGLIPMDPEPSASHAAVAFIRSERPGFWHGVMKWLNTPMGNAPVAWRRMVVRRVS